MVKMYAVASKLANIIQGRKARANGSNFESELISSAIADQITIFKIPDGCRRAYIKGRVQLLPVQTPFDFFAATSGRCAFFDAKTTTGKRFSYSSVDQRQVESLLKLYQENMIAGYVVRFEEIQRTVFFDVIKLKQLTPRKSLSAYDGIDIGPSYRPELLKLFQLDDKPGAVD